MSERDNTAEQTLPSVALPAVAAYGASQLVLTIVFHPDTGRIGETAVLRPTPRRQSMILGRSEPRFRPVAAAAVQRPLADPYVSRSALVFQWRGSQLRVEPGHAATRCRVGGTELTAAASLDRPQLCRGVRIMLGHSVVLLLRLIEAKPVPAGAAENRGIIGSSTYSLGLRRQIAEAARTDLDVLILGESGTGKELVASAIHSGSARSRASLVAVNMSAIPESLAPAALFGSTRGAFTGADKAGVGYFGRAEGGTLFLDEVGDTHPGVQPQLLRALQQREIQVVGGSVRRVDLRVVSATDVLSEPDHSEFRAALRHRLGALEISLLPLREHPEDIGELCWHFLRDALSGSGKARLLPAPDSPPMEVARWADLFYRCLGYHWPGNVRELINRARQVAVSSEERLDPPAELYDALGSPMVTASPDRASADPVVAMRRAMEDVSQQEFVTVWEHEKYEVAAVAKRLGVSRQAVYRRLENSVELRTAGDISVAELSGALRDANGDPNQAAMNLRVSRTGLMSRIRQLGLPVRPDRG